MAEHKVLITTSGLGSRLGNVTQFTNKSLVSIGDKPVISHIIESYNSKTEFIITLGHYGDQVKQFLKYMNGSAAKNIIRNYGYHLVEE